MSKSIIKYLSILSIAILSGISMLYANTLADGGDFCSFHKTEINNHVAFKPIQQSDDKNLVFEIAETQEIENEESISETNLYDLQSFLSQLLKVSLDEALCFLPKTNPYYYKNYHDKSSTKLHVRLQVFII